MTSYKIAFKRSGAKKLRRILKKDVRRILKRIYALSEDPRPAGAEKPTEDGVYCLRNGDYRLVYAIEEDVNTVIMARVGHCRDVYRWYEARPSQRQASRQAELSA